MTEEEILEKVMSYGCPRVTLTGGLLLWIAMDLEDLIRLLTEDDTEEEEEYNG